MEERIEKIDALLPQTQCEQCEFAGCRAYATALAKGETQLNRCPPGGEPLIRALSQLLDQPELPLDESLGEYRPAQIAKIDESLCIGCVKCILACPVDAIVGTRRWMHTIIESECTGCELCIPPCPMNCIDLYQISSNTEFEEHRQNGIGLLPEQKKRAPKARKRFEAHKERLNRRDLLSESHLPSEQPLAEIPENRSSMQSLIAMAKKEYKKSFE